MQPTDEYEIKTENKKWLIKVTELLGNRVAYSEAIKHYTDITPEEEINRIKFVTSAFHTGKRLSKVGRPSTLRILEFAFYYKKAKKKFR